MENLFHTRAFRMECQPQRRQQSIKTCWHLSNLNKLETCIRGIFKSCHQFLGAAFAFAREGYSFCSTNYSIKKFLNKTVYEGCFILSVLYHFVFHNFTN